MSVTTTPYMVSFTLTDTNAHQLSALLQDTVYVAAADQPKVPSSGNLRAAQLEIGNDIGNGGATLKTGNSTMTTAKYGRKLIAGQEQQWGPFESNLIRLNDIYLLVDTNPTVVTVVFTTR